MSSSVKIGETELSLIKENVYKIETNKIILDSIRDNMEQHNIDMNTSIHKSVTYKRSHTRSISEAEIKASSIISLSKFLNKKENKHGLSFDVMLHFIGNIGNQLTFLKNE